MSRFITVKQYLNKWQDDGWMEIDPTHVSYIENVRNSGGGSHSKIHTIFGGIIEVGAPPRDVRKAIEAWHEQQEADNKDKIVITKDDVVKNFIFRNMTQGNQ